MLKSNQVFKQPLGDEIQLVVAQVQLLQVRQLKCVQLSDEVIGQVQSSDPYIQIHRDRREIPIVPGLLLEIKGTQCEPQRWDTFKKYQNQQFCRLKK